MKIKNLCLKNFGIYEEKNFQFNTISVLLDKNGAGKSTVLRALNFALDGDFKKDMVREGQTEMAVSITFDSDLTVMRIVKNGLVTHKMGYGKPKTSTKEKVNSAIAEMTNTTMDSLKVVASSSDIFAMKPEELSIFFMSNIPKVMTTEKAISYIEDITPSAEQKIRSLLPVEEFDISVINKVYETLYEERRELSKIIRNDRLIIGNYDFSAAVRSSEEVQQDLTNEIKHLGELESRSKEVAEWQKLKKKRTATLMQLKELQAQVKEIVVTGIPETKEDQEHCRSRLKKDVDDLNEQIIAYSRNLASIEPAIQATTQIIERLKEGMCPQLKGMKCPNNWTSKIQELNGQLSKMKESYVAGSRELTTKKKEFEDAKRKLSDFEKQKQLFEQRQLLVERYRTLRPTLQELPAEPAPVDASSIHARKAELEKELNTALRHEQLVAIHKQLPAKEETLKLLEKLVNAFSPKGEILSKNLKFYLDFFEKQINVKATKLGYVIQFDCKNGLVIKIGKTGRPVVNINLASGGEKAVALFLLLDLFNSITGVNLLFFDEVEVFDTEVFEKLLDLIKENVSDYDHIIIAGVDHKDTLDSINKKLS